MKRRKIGFILLLLWLTTLVSFSLALVFNPTASKWFSPTIDSIIIFVLQLGCLFLLPIAAFMFKSKLFKIVSLSPLILFVLLLVTLRFVVLPHKIDGSSMSPAINNGQYIVGENISYLFKKPKRGDIIVYKHGSTNYSPVSILRIIAVPGDKIKIKNGFIYVNEKLLVESYVTGKTTGGEFLQENTEYNIGSNQYIGMGDNRFHSLDSRVYGPIDINKIRGKVFYSYWQKGKIGFIKNQAPVLTTNFINDDTEQKSETTCITLGTKMMAGIDNKGQIGCDVYINGKILDTSFCESQQTHKRQPLRPDLYKRPNRYFATLTGLNFDESVKVYVYSLDGKMVECLPDLNKL